MVITATDNAGFGGFTAAVHLGHRQHADGDQPGLQPTRPASPSALASSATDSSSTATITTWSATGLPAGLAIGTSSGVISGTPTTAGTYTVALTATDSAGVHRFGQLHLDDHQHRQRHQPGPRGPSGSPITALQAMATDSSSTATLSYTAPGLPAGLTITSAGLITGTPITAGAYPVALTATDSAECHRLGQLHLDGHQHHHRHQPGPPVGRLGQPHHRPAGHSHRLVVDGHPGLHRHRPARRPVHRLERRAHRRHADHVGDFSGHRHGQ